MARDVAAGPGGAPRPVRRGRAPPARELGHLEFAANVDMEAGMALQLDALRNALPPWLLWQSSHDCLRFARQAVPGMTSPQLYLKRRGVWTGGHEENLRFSSVNCCHGPGSSTWPARPRLETRFR